MSTCPTQGLIHGGVDDHKQAAHSPHIGTLPCFAELSPSAVLGEQLVNGALQFRLAATPIADARGRVSPRESLAGQR
jgi:hypothetical protein